MKQIIIALLLSLPIKLIAQNNPEVNFEQNLNWQQIQEKAQSEHKLIFIDCYATWCGPCKMMDNEVYNNPQVAAFANEHFVSVKLQLDSDDKDIEQIKAWYSEANRVKKDYQVTAMPTFLFFSADGKLLHKDVGFRYAEHFLNVLNDAITPDKQEYALFDQVKNGKLGYDRMPALIALLKKDRDENAAQFIIKKYINNYLLNQPDSTVMTKDNLNYFSDYLIETAKIEKAGILSDKAYIFFKARTREIDKITSHGFSHGTILDVIWFGIARSVLWADMDFKNPISASPDWRALAHKINETFGKGYSDEIIFTAKVHIYEQTGQWDKLIAVNVAKIDRKGVDTTNIFSANGLNNFCFNTILKYSNDKQTLLKAARWMHVINLSKFGGDPGYMDTEANLMYKAGEQQQAVNLETRAIDLEIERTAKTHLKPDQTYLTTLNHMKAGEPTWNNIP